MTLFTTFLWTCAIQTSAILLIAICSLPLLRRKSAAVRHCVLVCAILCASAVPILNLVVPRSAVSRFLVRHPEVAPLQEKIVAIAETLVDRADPGEAAASEESTNLTTAAVGAPSLPVVLWSIGALAGVLVLMTGLTRLARVASMARPMQSELWTRTANAISREYGLRPLVRLVESGNPSILVTWGAIRPSVILPAGAREWPEDRVRIVLRHELAHIRRLDWLAQMTAQTLRIVYWFNPLVWIVCRRLRLESECACDDAVLRQDIKGHEYAGHLLDLAQTLNRTGLSWSTALTMARPSTLERRFSAMLNPRLNRRPTTRFAMLAIVLAGLGLTLSLSALVAAAQTGQNPPAAGAPQSRPVTRDIDRALYEAAANEDISKIDGLLRDGANVNAAVSGDGSPLIGAAGTGRLQIAQALLDRGADPNMPVSGDGNPLIAAASAGHLDIVTLLLNRGANPNTPVPGDGNALIGAARRGRLQVAEALLDRGADPNMAVSGDGNPLIAAASAGHLDIVTLLLNRGANPNASVDGDGNALIKAAGAGRTGIVTLLLDRGANIEQVVAGDENALITASARGQLAVVQLLVSRRADVNSGVVINGSSGQPGERRTPLSAARKAGHQDIVQFLLSVGARE